MILPYLLLWSALSTSEIPLPSAAALLARHLEAIGGKEAAGAVVSQVRKGSYQMGVPGSSFPAEVHALTTGKWQFTLIIPGTYSLEYVSDGKSGWIQTPEGTQPMRAGALAEDDSAFNPAAVLRPQEYLSAMQVKERQKARGRDVWVVEAQRPEGKTVTAQFDVETGLLTALGNTIFEDYRLVDGVRVPHTIRLTRGRREEVFATTEVRNNAPVKESRFDKAADTAAYQVSLRRITRDALVEALAGVEAGAAKGVLEDLHGFSPADGRILYDRIVAGGYRRGLEIGTAQGNSAIWMAMAFRKTGGKLITIEIDPSRARAAMENFRKASLDQVVECRNNDAFKEIPLLEGDFDFVFLDTGTALHKKFLDVLYPRIAKGGIVSSHNANTFAAQMPDFLQAITTDSHLATEILRTPTGGFSFSLKKD